MPHTRSIVKTTVKKTLIAAISGLAAVSTWAQLPGDYSAVDAKLNACSAGNPSNPGVSNCTMAAKAAADQRLNDVYGGLIDALKHPKGPDDARVDPEILKRLIAAERAWIAFRDAECNYQSSVALGGRRRLTYAACRYKQIKEQVRGFNGA